MANKRLAQHLTKVQGSKGLADKASALRKEGYIPITPDMPNTFGDGKNELNLHDYIGAQLIAGNNASDSNRRIIPLLFASGGNEVPVTTVGDPKRGYISWGANNRVPNIIALLTNLIPFTAAGWKFNTDLASGMGPVPIYHYVEVSNGQVMERDIPYENAGELLKGRIKRLDAEKQQQEQKNTEQNLVDLNGILNAGNQQEQNNGDGSILDKQIADAKSDLAIWEQTNAELKDFMRRNNLNLVFTQLFGDQIMFGICFPEIQLQQTYIDPTTNKPVTGDQWRPKAVGLGYRMAHVCRLERKDTDGRIRNVYISNSWLDPKEVVMSGDVNPNEIAALPALDVYNPTGDLDDRTAAARQQKAGKNARPTRLILPCYYPTVGRPYYPVPAWWSIYGGDIYEYAATLVADRLQQKKNSNVIGRIIYVHQTYLDNLYIQQGADTPEKKEKWRNAFYNQVNNFLMGRTNRGKSLLGFNFLDANGNEHKTFEIVEIQDTSKSTADANKTELQEISSIIFFAMGLDAKLIGNEPGITSSSGGTDLRERYLLKQIQMTPTQQLVMQPLYVIKNQNGWDDHLQWQIRREVMTTLDNSKTGVTTAKDNSQQ